MRKVVFYLTLVFLPVMGFSQSKAIDTLKLITLSAEQKEVIKHFKDSIDAKKVKDSTRWALIDSSVQYPAIKGERWSGIIPVKNVTEIPDPNIKYKLLFELTWSNPDSMRKEVNYGLTEIARVINLHVASGVPLKNIEPVIVVHAAALHSIRSNESFKKKYSIDNPNLPVIDKLKGIGAKFIACGQAMTFLNIPPEDLMTGTKVSLTAQTVLSHYQLKGFVLYRLDKMD